MVYCNVIFSFKHFCIYFVYLFYLTDLIWHQTFTDIRCDRKDPFYALRLS